MGIFYTQLPALVIYLSWLLAAGLLVHAARTARWKLLEAPTVFSAWCASIIMLTLLWRMRVHITHDLNLHLMGIALFSLMFGRALSILGLALAVLAYTANFDGAWANLGLNILLLATLPVWISHALLRLTQWYLPHNMFVYLFGNGFFGSVVVHGSVGLAAFAAHAWLLPETAISSDMIAYMLLLAWGEAFLSGFLLTIFAVYRPAWVLTFDDALYLHPRAD
ncbi:energy-coupling factor ABC transporter permease [soil metagenome]